MINKRINGNKYIRKKIGGDGYSFKDNIFVVYNLFSYLLLYISYILFCIATIIFLNACLILNFKKAGYDNYERDKDGKTIFLDKPIFEYLKTNNFMYIDDYLLSKDSAIFIAIISIFSISLTAIICILLIVKNKGIDDERMTFMGILRQFMENKLYILPLITYIFIFIIIIIYNENKKNNKDSLNDNEYNTKINYTIYEGNYDEPYLINLKNKIINILENDSYGSYITNASTGFNFFNKEDIRLFPDIIKNDKNFGEVGEDKKNILNRLFSIYKYGYDAIKNGKEEKDKINSLNAYKIKYIKHINDYFELLIRDKTNKNDKDDKDDFYKKYYIFGLEKKFPDDPLNTNFNDLLVEIAKKVNAYYIVIIVFYPLLFLIIAPIIIYKYEKEKTMHFIIDSLYYFNINFQKIFLIFCIIAFISYFIFYYNKSV
jgi:hypothetical protein